jgi:hypothetical protein
MGSFQSGPRAGSSLNYRLKIPRCAVAPIVIAFSLTALATAGPTYWAERAVLLNFEPDGDLDALPPTSDRGSSGHSRPGSHRKEPGARPQNRHNRLDSKRLRGLT